MALQHCTAALYLISQGASISEIQEAVNREEEGAVLLQRHSANQPHSNVRFNPQLLRHSQPALQVFLSSQHHSGSKEGIPQPASLTAVDRHQQLLWSFHSMAASPFGLNGSLSLPDNLPWDGSLWELCVQILPATLRAEMPSPLHAAVLLDFAYDRSLAGNHDGVQQWVAPFRRHINAEKIRQSRIVSCRPAAAGAYRFALDPHSFESTLQGNVSLLAQVSVKDRSCDPHSEEPRKQCSVDFSPVFRITK